MNNGPKLRLEERDGRVPFQRFPPQSVRGHLQQSNKTRIRRNQYETLLRATVVMIIKPRSLRVVVVDFLLARMNETWEEKAQQQK